MNKNTCKALITQRLREALNNYQSSSGLTQEKLAEKLHISPRACSSLQNGKSGFSAFSILVLFSLLPETTRTALVSELCEIILEESPNHDAA